MKKEVWLLLFTMCICAACNSNGKPEPIAKDSVAKNPADSFDHNPAMPAAQNSDDPDRFSQ